jgi:peptidoglycan/LPS O-acetylase OafA/YrhL
VDRCNYLPQLTSLRFFAAFAVVLVHFKDRFQNFAPRWFVDLTWFGAGGVSFFFVLSGFILSFNYYQSISTGQQNLIHFFRSRFARIYPLYLLTMLMVVPRLFLVPEHPSSLYAAEHPVRTMVVSLLALQTLDPPTYAVFNGPAWSVSTELAFYALFPFLVGRVSKIPNRFVLAGGGIMLALNIVAPLVFALRDVQTESTIDFIRIFFVFRLPEFVLGIFAFRLFSMYRKGGRPKWLPVATILSAAYWLFFVVFTPTNYTWLLLHHMSVGVPVTACIILWCAFGKGALVNKLSHPWLVFLGESSYALYMIHMPVFLATSYVGKKMTNSNFEGPIGSAITIGFILLLSIFLFLYVERPARRWINQSSTNRHSTQ